jgi:hypothetical protein
VTRLTTLTAALAIAAGLSTTAPAHAGDRGFCNLAALRLDEQANMLNVNYDKWWDIREANSSNLHPDKVNQATAVMNQIKPRMKDLAQRIGLFLVTCAGDAEFSTLQKLRNVQGVLKAKLILAGDAD